MTTKIDENYLENVLIKLVGDDLELSCLNSVYADFKIFSLTAKNNEAKEINIFLDYDFLHVEYENTWLNIKKNVKDLSGDALDKLLESVIDCFYCVEMP